MIEFVKGWCEEIIVSVIVSLIVEMFVPKGNIKKYVRVVVGIYIVFVILNPIVSNLDNINIDNMLKNYESSNTLPTSNIEEMSNVYARAMESQIKQDFNYISEVRVFLTENLEDVEKIEITLLEEVDSLEELKKYLMENYGVTEEKISIV